MLKEIKTELGTFYRALETEDFVYFVNYQEGDENDNTIVYRKEPWELVSDDLHASNDLVELVLEEKYTWISAELKKGFSMPEEDFEFPEDL